MRNVDIFIASSFELYAERIELCSFIRKLNEAFNPRGINLVNHQWEFLDDSLQSCRAQDQYNKVLDDCEICIVMFWKRCGIYSQEEMKRAYDRMCDGHLPKKIYVYFKNVDNESLSQNDLALYEELQEYKNNFPKHFNENFPSGSFKIIDTLKLDILFQLELYFNCTVDIVLNSINLQNVPYISKSAEFGRLIKEIQELYYNVSKYPNLQYFKVKLNNVKKELQEHVNAIICTARIIERIKQDNINNSADKAKQLLEKGLYNDALALLDNKAISDKISACKAKIESEQSDLVSAINNYILKCRALYFANTYNCRDNCLNNNWKDSCLDIYRSAVNEAKGFLSDKDFAIILYRFSIFFFDIENFPLSEKICKQALKIWMKLSETSPEIYKPYVALALFSLALIYSGHKHFIKAKKIYKKAITIWENLDINVPDGIKHNIARILFDSGCLHSCRHQHHWADNDFGESLKIWKDLANTYPGTFDPIIVETLRELAYNHYYLNLPEIAENEYKEAIDISIHLFEISPEKYYMHWVGTLRSLTTVHTFSKRYEEAENECQEALRICIRVAETEPDAELQVAWSYNNLAELHRKLERYDDSETEYRMALDIIERHAKVQPKLYEHNIATISENIRDIQIQRKKQLS